MQGWKTLIVNMLVLFASVVGVTIEEAEATAVAVGIVAVANLVLRFYTKTPVMEKERD